MVSLLVTWAVLSFGQIEQLGYKPEVPPPPEGYVYEGIDFHDGTTIFGFVRQQGQVLTVIPDEPWRDDVGRENINESRVKAHSPEGESARKSRLAEGFKAAGYTLVDGYWIPKQEVELSERAKEMYAPTTTPNDTPQESAPAAAEATQAEANAAAQPSPLQRWGLHGAVALVALVLVAVVAKTMLLS